MSQFNTPLDLASIMGGDLNEDFKNHYQDVLSSLLKGEKGTITMKVTINRLADMDTLVSLEYSIAHTKPARKKSSYASIVDNGEQLSLKVEKPVKPIDNVSLLKPVDASFKE